MLIDKRYFNTQEASYYTGWSKSYFDHIRLTGHLQNLTPGPPFIKKGRRVLYDKNDLDTWLKQHRFEESVPIRAKLKIRRIPLARKQPKIERCTLTRPMMDSAAGSSE